MEWLRRSRKEKNGRKPEPVLLMLCEDNSVSEAFLTKERIPVKISSRNQSHEGI